VKTHSGEAGAGTGAAGADGADCEANSRCTVVILDSITDPHNVGAILRSCDQFGASLVVIPEHNSASDIAGNEVIGRTSAGASAWVPVAIVNNLVRAAEQLKQAGFWIYGADAGGSPLGEAKFSGKTAIIMGSEGTGMSRLLREKCDVILSIPTCGKLDSLNVSVAAGVLLYEIHRQKLSQAE
jgi:23S rRNA (guanosine2251-2'-O)-methyltransferase